MLATNKRPGLFVLIIGDNGRKFYYIDTMSQHFKTFFYLSLMLWQNKLECLLQQKYFFVYHCVLVRPDLTLMEHLAGALGLTHKYKTLLKMLARNKRPSLFVWSINGKGRKFYNIDTMSQQLKLFLLLWQNKLECLLQQNIFFIDQCVLVSHKWHGLSIWSLNDEEKMFYNIDTRGLCWRLDRHSTNEGKP